MRVVLKATPLLLVCLGLVVGCGGGKQQALTNFREKLPTAVAESIEEVVEDPVRSQEAQNEAIKLEYAIRDYGNEMWKARVRAYYLNAKYDVGEDELRSQFDEMKELRARRQEQIIEIAMQGRAILTEQEWAELHDVLGEKMAGEPDDGAGGEQE